MVIAWLSETAIPDMPTPPGNAPNGLQSSGWDFAEQFRFCGEAVAVDAQELGPFVTAKIAVSKNASKERNDDASESPIETGIHEFRQVRVISNGGTMTDQRNKNAGEAVNLLSGGSSGVSDRRPTTVNLL